MTLKQLISKLKENLNLELKKEQVLQIEQFVDFLLEENKITNLTAITDKESVYLKHIYDSVTLVNVLDIKNNHLFYKQNIVKVLDIGTGAGFPGIVLKIIFPNIQLTLLDSNNKKTTFLEKSVKILNLKDVNIIKSRAEEYIVGNREKYDLVTSRAVARLNVLLELAIPFVKKEGIFISMKGIEDPTETKEGIEATQELKCKLEKSVKFDLPIENSARVLYLFEKNQETPLKYPRRYEQIKKKPLKKNIR